MQGKFPHLYPSAQVSTDTLAVTQAEAIPPRPPTPTPAGISPGVQQVINTVDGLMPMIEGVTGLTRREISLQLLKTGLKGGSWGTLFDGLIKQPEKMPKIALYAKTIVTWGLIALFFGGIALITLVLYARVITSILGGI